MDEREALLWLHLCPGLSERHCKAWLRLHGSALSARQAVRRQGLAGPGPDDFRRALRSQWVAWTDSLYPPRLLHLTDAPLVLFYAGDLARLQTLPASVAVVGTRQPTSRGRELAGRFGRQLCCEGLGVLSGLARGIDSAVHQGSLESDRGASVAVVGCGLDRTYPPENAPLQHRLERQGLVLSEYAPGTPPLRWHFPARNRLLAALSHLVLVVEAPRKSGALITVDYALRLGREVYTLPGPLDHENYEGNLNLLEDGAGLARTPFTLIQAVLGEQARFAARAWGGPAMTTEEWSSQLGLPLTQTLVQLSLWETVGQVQRTPEGLYLRRN